jgi:hypothetical protein
MLQLFFQRCLGKVSKIRKIGCNPVFWSDNNRMSLFGILFALHIAETNSIL